MRPSTGSSVVVARPLSASTQGDLELLALLTRLIAGGRPLDAVALIDRVLATGPTHRDPIVVADLGVLRSVAELELARQIIGRSTAGSSSSCAANGGTIATILEFADRILPVLQRVDTMARHSSLSGTRQDWRRPGPADTVDAPPARRALSEREFEVLHLVAIGMSNVKIAQTLFISEGTVKKHLSNVLAKLGAENRTEAVALARRQGILD